MNKEIRYGKEIGDPIVISEKDWNSALIESKKLQESDEGKARKKKTEKRYNQRIYSY